MASITCATPPSPTTRYEYDAAHRVTKVTDPLNHTGLTTYDLNGNVATTTDAAGSVTKTFYDARNLPIKVEQPYLTGASPRILTTQIDYDAVGNRTRLITPRAWDASPDKVTFSQFVTSYVYDQVNRLVRVDMPTSVTDTLPLYVHHSYDKTGRPLWTSLPTSVSDPGVVPSDRKTTMTYFDPGWIRTSEPPSENPSTQPAMHFDYSAEGWQTKRVPEFAGQPDRLNERQAIRWEYFTDGKVRAIKDRDGQVSTYGYDANNNLITAIDSSGLTGPSQTRFDVDATYNGFDELSKARRKLSSGNFRTTKFTYDQNGNIDLRQDDGDETPTGTPLPVGSSSGSRTSPTTRPTG